MQNEESGPKEQNAQSGEQVEDDGEEVGELQVCSESVGEEKKVARVGHENVETQ